MRGFVEPVISLSYWILELLNDSKPIAAVQSTEVRFASFPSGEFTTMTVMNPPEKKLEKRTSVH